MKVFLGQPWGGLGDNLQFSTLPRLYAERGDEFYLSSDNAYRNDEIYEFCWGNNPYVKGIADVPPNIGACMPWPPEKTIDNIISVSEFRHGFTPVGRYPEIYYTPKLLSEYQDKTIVDLSAHTLLQNGVASYYDVEKLFSKIRNLIPDDAILVTFKHSSIYSFSGDFAFESNQIKIDTIYQYADIIHSAKEYYCLYSGSNALSAAIKNQNNSRVKLNSFIYRTVQENKDIGFFVFDNVNYIEL